MVVSQSMAFPSTSLYTIIEAEEPSPQPSNMEIFGFDIREKELPIHPLNAILVQQKHIRFCKDLTDYFVDPGSELAQCIFSEIDDALKDTQLDMLHALYGSSNVRENKGDFKSLWEDDCFYPYEDIDPEIGKRIKAARQTRASQIGPRQIEDAAIHRGSGDGRPSVKREETDDVNEENDDISFIMGHNAPFGLPEKKKDSTYNLAEILKSTSLLQPPVHKRPDTPSLRRESDLTSLDRAKKHLWRRKPAKDKLGSKKLKMEYSHPYGQAMAEDEVRMGNVSVQKSRDYIRQMLSPSHFDDPNASMNMTRFRYSTELRSINSEDQPISQRGDMPLDRTLQSVIEDGIDLETLLGQIDRIYKQRCIPLTQKYSRRRYEIDHDLYLSPEEQAEALAKLAEEEGKVYKELADQTGKTYRNDPDVMRHLVRLAKEMRTNAVETGKKEPPPPPKSTLNRLRSAGGKTFNWLLAIPDDDDLTSEAVYIPYGATNMFPQPLQSQVKVSASETAVSTAGSSTGVSRKRSMDEERKISKPSLNSNSGPAVTDTPAMRGRRPSVPQAGGSMTLVESRGGRNNTGLYGERRNEEVLRGGRRSEDVPSAGRSREDARCAGIYREDSPKKPDPTWRQQRYYEHDFELRERESSETGTQITQMPTRSEFEGKRSQISWIH